MRLSLGLRRVRSALRMICLVLAAGSLAGCFGAGIVRVGDNDPHPGVRRAHTMPIQGVDVARYQGDIDWHAARAAGTRFAFIKATEGGDYVDPKFERNWRKAHEAGIARGAYHFIYWCRSAVEQANWFKANVPNDPYALPPVLDLEWNNHSSCKHSLTPDEAWAKARTILAAMEEHTGKLPIIYTDINFHRDVLAGREHYNTLWLRSVAAEPHERYDSRPFTFWQWTQTGTMPGISGEVDRNAFYGTEDEWVRFILTGCDPRAISVLGPMGRCTSLK